MSDQDHVSNVADRIDIIADRVGSLSRDCEAKHQRHGGEIAEVNRRVDRVQAMAIGSRERLIGVCGEDGKNGKLSAHDESIKALKAKVDAMDNLITRHLARASLIAAAAAVIFSAIANRFL